MKILFFILLMITAGCSSSVIVKDNDSTENKGCIVTVGEGFAGSFGYESERCKIDVLGGELHAEGVIDRSVSL